MNNEAIMTANNITPSHDIPENKVIEIKGNFKRSNFSMETYLVD